MATGLSRVRPLQAQAISLRSNPALALGAAVPLCAVVVGAALAADARMGVALLLGLIFAPIALLNLQLALVLWFPLIFLEGLSAFNLAAKAGGLVITAAWFGAITRNSAVAAPVLRRHTGLVLAVSGLLLWYSLSLLWAEDLQMVGADLWHWYAVALLMLVVATTVTTARVARMMVAAFVVGALLAVGHGIVTGGLTAATTAVETASEGRLEGAQGDPNFLAAGIVPAMILAAALFVTTRNPLARWPLGGAIALLALGLVASESRGGAVAAAAATVAAFVLFKHRRAWVLAFVTVVLGVAAAWFTVSPSALDRITAFDNGGSGRTELWTVAMRMAEANPVLGVGLNNYPVVSGDYVREPGTLSRLDLIVDRAQVTHNVYVQLLAETGVVGLGLFLAVALGSLYAAYSAARRYDARGDPSLATLSRGVLVATIGLLASSFFISNGVDKRLWVLFALGPALLAVALRQEREPPAGGDGLSGERGGVPLARAARA